MTLVFVESRGGGRESEIGMEGTGAEGRRKLRLNTLGQDGAGAGAGCEGVDNFF